MEQVLKSLNDANEQLTVLIKEASDKNALLVKKLDEVAAVRKDLADRIEVVSKREIEVKKFESLEAGCIALDKANAELAKAKADFVLEQAKIKGTQEDIDKKLAELENLAAIYRANDLNVKKEREALEVEKANMKQSILEQIGKGLK